MLRTIAKTLGGAIAVMCLVSTLAMASEMTCASDDGKGNCTAVTGADGRTAIVVGAGLKAGEQIDCINRGTVVECRTAQVAPPVVMVAEMTCVTDDGKGTCTAATGADGRTATVVGQGLKAGEQMDCMDKGTMIQCRAVR